MNGVYNRELSWEKAKVFDLENGWQAKVEFGYYGDHITRLDSPNRDFYWHCSSGIGQLPEFARPWLRGGGWFIDENLVEPRFKKVYE